MTVNSDFGTWACSFAGCDGGDLTNSELWISGIEWGYGKSGSQTPDEYEQELRNYYENKLPQEFVSSNDPYAKQYHIGEQTGYQFGRTLAKLYAAINGHDVADYQRIGDSCTGSEIFKLNLYPIGFPSTADHFWKDHNLASLTGLSTKGLYRTWCSLHRFPFFVEQVRKYKPKLIIGAGITYLTEFALAFGGQKGIESFGHTKVLPESGKNGKARDLYWGRIGDYTTLVVTPFFGNPHNLNSDYLIGEFARQINRLIKG